MSAIDGERKYNMSKPLTVKALCLESNISQASINRAILSGELVAVIQRTAHKFGRPYYIIDRHSAEVFKKNFFKLKKS